LSLIRRRVRVQPIDQFEDEHGATLDRLELALLAGGLDQAQPSEGFGHAAVSSLLGIVNAMNIP